MPIKWTFNSKYKFGNKNFAEIYTFYVIETPVPGVSARGKTFKARLCNMNKLNSALKSATPFLKTNWDVKAVKDIEACCKTHKIATSVSFVEECAIHTINGKHCTGNTDSLFYTIRCAFAHGSFSIHTHNGDTFYLLENRDGSKLKGRLVVKEETLLEWKSTLEKMYP